VAGVVVVVLVEMVWYESMARRTAPWTAPLFGLPSAICPGFDIPITSFIPLLLRKGEPPPEPGQSGEATSRE
jgi:hypothetical protein